jgi:hypothetical protein
MSGVSYTPPPTVKEFIKHYTPGELFLDWIVGPVGSGKTTGIFFKLIYMAQKQAKSPIDGIRRSRCVIVRSTAPQLADTTIKSFMYWFRDGVAGKWQTTIKNFTLKFGDVECEVMFRPLESADDINRVLSLEVTFAIIDEFVQIPREIVEALSARCGRYPPEIEGGATNWGMWGASNPGMESDWWYPFLEDNTLIPEDDQQPTNWVYFKQPSGFADGSRKYGGKVAENTENLPGRADYYTNLQKGKTDHWIKQFIEVAWGYSMNGKPVFPEFNPNIHMADRPIRWNPALPILIGYDPGNRSGVTLGQYHESVGRITILREIAEEGYATDRLISDKIKPMLKRDFPGCSVLVIPDPSSVNASQSQTGSSVLTTLKKHFSVDASDKDNSISSRLDPMKYYLSRLTQEGPAIIFDPSCVKLKRAFISGYKFTVSKSDGVRDIPDKNLHSNIADSCTYLVRYCRKGEIRTGRRIEKGHKFAFTPARNSYNMR